LLLILPGFLTDFVGFLLIIPITRKFFIKSLATKFKRKETYNNTEDVIEGSFEEQKKDEKED